MSARDAHLLSAWPGPWSSPGRLARPCSHLLLCLSGAQPLGLPYYTDPGGPGMNPAGNPVAMAFQVQPNSSQGSTAYPPPPSYCNTPPPPYEQVVKTK
nr:vesicular, overexpressed in cancer, prosurvival protein 1 [Odocoileus virginianus texanus]